VRGERAKTFRNKTQLRKQEEEEEEEEEEATKQTCASSDVPAKRGAEIELGENAADAPHVDVGAVREAKQDFGSTVETRLNVAEAGVVLVASTAKVNNLKRKEKRREKKRTEQKHTL
jgi:hypothetical protein